MNRIWLRIRIIRITRILSGDRILRVDADASGESELFVPKA